MKIPASLAKVLLFICAITCFSKAEDAGEDLSEVLKSAVATAGFRIVDMGSTYPLETLDRKFYKPLAFEIVNIHSKEPLDAYGGPTIGKYILAVEFYATEAEAEKRADEYGDLSRLASVTEHDEQTLSKMTVRCGEFQSGKRVYLLTTLAAMWSAMEAENHSVIDGIKKFEAKAGK